MRAYYLKRAAVYDHVYGYPERQRDLAFLRSYVARQFARRNVLEIAAGTGYWTAVIAAVARSMIATDISAALLARAARRAGVESVRFVVADAYDLRHVGDGFDGVFAGLWFSHVPRQRRDEFLRSLHRLSTPGAVVVLIDNSATQCEWLPITFTDAHGNTWQDRTLDDGATYRVLKNFPTYSELVQLTRPFAARHEYMSLQHFWVFRYVHG